MKFLKGLALSLLSFLLFLSLSLFGSFFMLNKTLLNPDFVTAEVDRLAIASLAGEFFSRQAPPKTPYLTEIEETITDLEPLVKEEVNAALYSIYNYLLGKSQSLDLALTLRDTILSRDFVISIVDKLDIASLVVPLLSEQLTKGIPPGMEYLAQNLDKYLDDAITQAQPAIKEQISAAADPVLDYLLGQRQSLKVTISLQPVMANLKDTLREVFLASPPAEIAMIPQALREQYFNQFYQQFSQEIPSTFELNESLLGTGMPAEIARALAEAEGALEQGRQYVGYFQLAYQALMGLMLLLVVGIILISRQVKDITRRLGIPCLTYGALGYASIFIGKYLADTRLTLSEIPASLQTWLLELINNLLAPLEMFNLTLLIGGIVLVIVSFVYKPRQS